MVNFLKPISQNNKYLLIISTQINIKLNSLKQKDVKYVTGNMTI